MRSVRCLAMTRIWFNGCIGQKWHRVCYVSSPAQKALTYQKVTKHKATVNASWTTQTRAWNPLPTEELGTNIMLYSGQIWYLWHHGSSNGMGLITSELNYVAAVGQNWSLIGEGLGNPGKIRFVPAPKLPSGECSGGFSRECASRHRRGGTDGTC